MIQTEFKQRLQRIKRMCADIVVVDNSTESVPQHLTKQDMSWQDDVSHGVRITLVQSLEECSVLSYSDTGQLMCDPNYSIIWTDSCI
jgi:hypothetical protein